MNKSHCIRGNNLHFLLIFFMMASATGCFGIKLIADYDEKTDKGVSALHRKTEEFLLKLESEAGKPEVSYDNSKKFYEEAKVEISSLRVRADAIHRNSFTVQMLDKLLTNINRLESDHKEGITKDEIPLYRGGFNSQFTAILTFEIAKKRGEKPDKKAASAPPTKKGESE